MVDSNGVKSCGIVRFAGLLNAVPYKRVIARVITSVARRFIIFPLRFENFPPKENWFLKLSSKNWMRKISEPHALKPKRDLPTA